MFVEIKPINPACLFINHAPASIIQLGKRHHVFYGRQQEQLNPTCAALPAGVAREDEKQTPWCGQSSQASCFNSFLPLNPLELFPVGG